MHSILEYTVEECRVGVADKVCNLRDAFFASLKIFTGFLYPNLFEIVAKAYSCLLCEKNTDVGKAVVHIFADFGKGNLTGIIVDNVIFDIGGNVLLCGAENLVTNQIN